MLTGKYINMGVIMDIIDNNGQSFIEKTFGKIDELTYELIDNYGYKETITQEEWSKAAEIIRNLDRYSKLVVALNKSKTQAEAEEALENILACHTEQYPQAVRNDAC